MHKVSELFWNVLQTAVILHHLTFSIFQHETIFLHETFLFCLKATESYLKVLAAIFLHILKILQLNFFDHKILGSSMYTVYNLYMHC